MSDQDQAAKDDKLEAEVEALLHSLSYIGHGKLGQGIVVWARDKLARLRQENHDLRNRLQDALGARQLAEAERDIAYVAGMRESLRIATDCMVCFDVYPGGSRTVASTRHQIVLAIAAAIAAREKP